MRPVDRRILKLLHASGLCDTDIGRHFGVTRQTIRYHRLILKLTSNRGVGRPRTTTTNEERK